MVIYFGYPKEAHVDIKEAYVVKVVLNRDNFNLYYKYLSGLNLEKETVFILDNLKSYFEKYTDVQDVKVEELLLHIYNNNRITKKDTLFEQLLIQAANADIKQDVLLDNFNSFLEQYFASEILYLLAEKQEDNSHNYLHEVSEILDAFEDTKVSFGKDTEESPFVSHDVSTSRKKKNDTPGLTWGITPLDLHLGPLRGKSLGHVLARVDTGKTTFIINLVRTWLPQLEDDEYILYLNNEEDGEKIMDRLMLSVLNITSAEADAKVDTLTQEFIEAGGTRCLLHDNAIIYISDIERMVNEHKIRAIIVDQADKLHFRGERNLSDVQRLQMIYAKLREISKKNNIDILTVGQASQSAENKKWLQPTDIDGSKTLKPGEFDYIIGIGRTFDGAGTPLEHTRYLHLCKNKMGTGVQARGECFIDPQRARYYNDNTKLLLGGSDGRQEREEHQGSGRLVQIYGNGISTTADTFIS